VFPEHRAFFWPEDWPPLSLNAFCLADILFIAMLGFIVSAFAFQQSPFLRPGLWLMLGAIGYASTYTISVAIGTGQGLLGATCMGMATIGFAHLTLAEMLADRDRVSDLFRTASNATAGRHRLATLCQISLMWPTILGLFPWAVWQLEQSIGIPGFYSSTGRIVGVVLFGMVSVVNLGTAWTLTSYGAGTPFPYDKTRELVVSVRPVEEQMMEEQFGASYVAYKAEVNCWLPRLFR
jgi:protein-S-isoprenylcysteine O-methyltransferase Ste14